MSERRKAILDATPSAGIGHGGNGSGVRTTCPYCGVGCGVLARPSSDGLSAAIRGDPNHPSNFGKLCSKGSSLGETLSLDERLLYPEVNGQRVSWGNAIDAVARGFRKTIADYGPDSVALYVSGQILTEDYYVANKLAKGFLGTANIDTNSRLCMASSVAGHKRAFGADTVPGCYEDLELADLVVITGSNFAWCHPVLHQRLLAAKEARGTKIIVIDPRKTATTESADIHLAIHPGTDVALFNGLLRYLENIGAVDSVFVAQHTTGVDKTLRSVGSMTLPRVSEITGVPEAQLAAFFQLFAQTENTVTVYSQGVNQSSAGTDKVNAIINAHLITGRIGRPGSGPFSITGQPNAMGGREVGGLANQLAAHMEFSPDNIERVRRFWNAPAMAQAGGLKAVDMFDAVTDGRIKAIWIIATNPVVSLPDADKVCRALEECPLVVVSEVSATSDTAAFADILLPATAWGEKTGTVTNSERRISRQRSFLKAPGEARHDWEAICSVARRMGFAGFEFQSASEIFSEHARLSGFENDGVRDFDISAFSEVSGDDYDAMQPFQWPAPTTGGIAGTFADNNHRFFGNGKFFTEDQRARFIAVEYRPPESACDEAFPLVLNTGRVRDQWHTMTRTGKAARLVSHIAEPFLEIHPDTASDCGLNDLDIAKVVSATGSARLRVLCTDRVAPGEVFAPIHWTNRYSGHGRIGALVLPNTDPVSGQPESKFTPVRLKRLKLDWYAFLVSAEEPSRDLLARADYWALGPAGKGWRLELAGCGEASELVKMIQPAGDAASVRFGSNQFVSSVFGAAGQLEFACYVDARPVAADRAWLCQQVGQVVEWDVQHAILAGRNAAAASGGRIICSCFGIGSGAIADSVRAGARTAESVGAVTRAGTNCGSCKPEIRKVIEATLAAHRGAQQIAAE